MVKLIRIEKEQLKIKAKEHKEALKKDAVGRKILEEEEKHIKKHLEKIKEEKEKANVT